MAKKKFSPEKVVAILHEPPLTGPRRTDMGAF